MGVCNRPAVQTYVSKRLQECHWLQAIEGEIDSSHVSFLHRGDLGSDPLFKGAKGNEYNLADMQPYFEVVEQPGGLLSAPVATPRTATTTGASRWVMPCFTIIPPRGDHPIHGHFWVPIDDEYSWAWSYDFHPVRALTRRKVDDVRGTAPACAKKYIPGTYRPLANKDNDYLMDRTAQKAGKTFSGVAGFAIQDASLQESMGPICDRTKENLVSTDNGIIMARHRLMRAARELVDKGGPCRPASTRRTTRCAQPRWCCRRTRRSRTPRKKR